MVTDLAEARKLNNKLSLGKSTGTLIYISGLATIQEFMILVILAVGYSWG